MGVSTDIRKMKWDELVAKLVHRNIPKWMVEKILLKSGEKIENWYIILNNERWEESNPFRCLPEIFHDLFPFVDEGDIFSDLLKCSSIMNNHGTEGVLYQLEEEGTIIIDYAQYDKEGNPKITINGSDT